MGLSCCGRLLASRVAQGGRQGPRGVAEWLCDTACASGQLRPIALHSWLDNLHTPCNDVMMFSDFFAYYDI